MPRGTPWDSLTCELRACAGLLPLFKGDWNYCWCSEVHCSDASKKKVVCVAHGNCLSRRASWLSFGTLSLPQSGGSEGAREHAFQQLGLADTATEDQYSETEYEEVQDFPDICAEMLSADAGRFVRDEDILPLEARSALPAVQCACERHPNVRILFLLGNLASVVVVDQGFLVLALIRSIHGIAYCAKLSFGFPRGSVGV